MSSLFPRINQTRSSMEEELQESEVMFSDSDSDDELKYYSAGNQAGNNANYCGNQKHGRSRPVDIPEINIYQEHADEEFADEDEGMVPPHVIMARRMESKMACSVYAPSGRVLKGRNLCQVRNSILRMTGFLES